ncbi:MAG: hydantoinase/oxoprolinase family protein, partial [Thermomicrobium sp.]
GSSLTLQSAGANPGPAAYGRGGEEPTVTDAAVVLGWLLPDAFLGGAMELDGDAARRVVRRIAEVLRRGEEEAALGIMEVAEANMEGAIRVVSVARGEDPREYALVAFGGAGPMVGCRLASKLHIPVVIIPPAPGVLSALGLLTADLLRDYLRTLMVPAESADTSLTSALTDLTTQAAHDLSQDGILPSEASFQPALDLRYRGQSYELTVPFSGDLQAAIRDFHKLHERLYGYAQVTEPVTVVNVRLRVVVPARRISSEPVATPHPWEPIPVDERSVVLELRGSPVRTRIPRFQREQLAPGALLVGPALVTQYDTTVVIPPGWRGVVDGNENIVLWSREAEAERHTGVRGRYANGGF